MTLRETILKYLKFKKIRAIEGQDWYVDSNDRLILWGSKEEMGEPPEPDSDEEDWATDTAQHTLTRREMRFVLNLLKEAQDGLTQASKALEGNGTTLQTRTACRAGFDAANKSTQVFRQYLLHRSGLKD